MNGCWLVDGHIRFLMAMKRPWSKTLSVTTSLSVCCSSYEDLTDVRDLFDGVRGSDWVLDMKGFSWLGEGPGARTWL